MLFLGGSQTFIGILASLIVLCVILDKSNFIHSILDEIGKRIDEEIKSLDKAVGFDVINDVPANSDYKLLQRYINELRVEAKTRPECKQLLISAMAMDMKLQATFDQLKSGYSSKFLKPAHDLIEKIQRSKEQVIAPLYALLFCLTVFICDEIVVGVAGTSDFVVSFLTIFVAFSGIFWLMMWKIFFRDIRIETEEGSSQKTKVFVSRWIRWKWMCFAFPMFYATCLFLSTFISIIWAKCLISFTIGIPICVMAWLKAKSHYEFGFYTYEYVFKHFGGLFLISFLFAVVTTGGCALSDDVSSVCFTYEDFVALKITVILFVLISGLLFPFLMPYYGFKRVLNIVKDEVKSSKQSMERELSSIKEELKEFCKVIP